MVNPLVLDGFRHGANQCQGSPRDALGFEKLTRWKFPTKKMFQNFWNNKFFFLSNTYGRPGPRSLVTRHPTPNNENRFLGIDWKVSVDCPTRQIENLRVGGWIFGRQNHMGRTVDEGKMKCHPTENGSLNHRAKPRKNHILLFFSTPKSTPFHRFHPRLPHRPTEYFQVSLFFVLLPFFFLVFWPSQEFRELEMKPNMRGKQNHKFLFYFLAAQLSHKKHRGKCRQWGRRRRASPDEPTGVEFIIVPVKGK